MLRLQRSGLGTRVVGGGREVRLQRRLRRHLFGLGEGARVEAGQFPFKEGFLRAQGRDRWLADCPPLHITRMLHCRVLNRGYWGRGLKKVKAVVPHASLCSSVVESGWRNIVG